jgi:hypothetical protein
MPIPSFKQFLILESFKDAQKKFIEELVSYSSRGEERRQEYTDRVNSVIDEFKLLKDRNQIKDERKDIGYWLSKDFDSFESFVKSSLEEYQNQKKVKQEQEVLSKDVYKIFENENALVVVPRTHEASCKYGSNTKWCLTYHQDSYWNENVLSQGLTPYYVIFKPKSEITEYDENLEKLAIMIDPYDGIHSIWDAEDARIAERGRSYRTYQQGDYDNAEPMSVFDLLEMYEIPYDEFVSKVTEIGPDRYEPTLADIEEFFDNINKTSYYSQNNPNAKYSEIEEAFNDLNEYYEENSVDVDDRLTPQDFIIFFEKNIELVHEYESNQFDYICTKKLSNSIYRTFGYEEYKLIQTIFNLLKEFLKEKEQNFLEDNEIRYEI